MSTEPHPGRAQLLPLTLLHQYYSTVLRCFLRSTSSVTFRKFLHSSDDDEYLLNTSWVPDTRLIFPTTYAVSLLLSHSADEDPEAQGAEQLAQCYAEVNVRAGI